MKKTVTITQSETPVPIEVIAESIVSISQGVQKLLAGPLNQNALELLITNACPKAGKGYSAKSMCVRDVRAVLQGLQQLESEYIKPKKST